ncbi:MAG: hypothetical protein IJC45_06920 [Clostridia bacterium]|nr:hypothetical protein [Clostridia bacterium]
MRVGITENDANDTVNSLLKWAEWLVSVITAFRNFLVSLGLVDSEQEEPAV